MAWALLCVVAGGILVHRSAEIASRPLRLTQTVGGLGMLLLGPAALAVYLFRARTVWVVVDHTHGLRVRGLHLIPWDGIVRIEHRRPRLWRAHGTPPIRPMKTGGSVDAWELFWFGCLGNAMPGLALIGLMLLAFGVFLVVSFLLLSVLVIPMLEVFTPLGDRVTIILRERSLVLRDLHNIEEFLRELRLHRPVFER